MRKHSYVAAEKFILSREFFGMKLGLKNIKGFLAELKNPQNSYLTIHIAGTNGKGSTAAMLASVLRANGYKTGLFTSPHLTDLRERITVNGRKITKSSVTAFINKNRINLSKRKISFFELIAAMAFEQFMRSEVDIAVIETGLGGRLDATNVLKPILTMTTEISRDHLEILGSSIKQITTEKAGIIKPGVTHLTAILSKDASGVIKNKCKELGAPLVSLSLKDYKINMNDHTLNFKYGQYSYSSLKPSLVGIHQLQNAALVLKAVSIINKLGMKMTGELTKRGISATVWPGRFQILKRKNKPIYIFDVAHNVSGTKAFVESFQYRFPGRKTILICGIVKRKEHRLIFDELSKIAENYCLVPLNSRRSTDLDELIKKVNWRKIKLRRFSSLERAQNSVSRTATTDDIITVIGSHYLIGEFFKKYKIK